MGCLSTLILLVPNIKKDRRHSPDQARPITMEKIKVRRQRRKHFYIHNDLANAAYHIKLLIEEKVKTGGAGVILDCMACLAMLAFTVEAKINFLGAKLVADWREKQQFDDKLKAVLDHLKLIPDLTKRPFSSVYELKDFRNSIAHGKPLEIESDEIVTGSAGEIDDLPDLTADWQNFCTPENVAKTSNDVDEFWKLLLKRSGLSVFDTLSGGSTQLTFVEKITEN